MPSLPQLLHAQKYREPPNGPTTYSTVLGLAKPATSIFDGYFQLSYGRASRFCISSLFRTVLDQIGYDYLFYGILFLTRFLLLRIQSGQLVLCRRVG
jgi:hypothetical protein